MISDCPSRRGGIRRAKGFNKMTPTFGIIFGSTLLFVALINPASKVAFLLSLSKERTKKEMIYLVLKSTLIGLGILIVFAYAGTFIIRRVFHIEIFSLQIAAGIVLFLIGLKALNKGRFFEIDTHKKLSDIAIVPFASPLIAGPATITAVISQSALFGSTLTSFSILIAVAINFLIMLLTLKIEFFLNRMGFIDSLVRIIGLFVASIGVNMVLVGIRSYLG